MSKLKAERQQVVQEREEMAKLKEETSRKLELSNQQLNLKAEHQKALVETIVSEQQKAI